MKVVAVEKTNLTLPQVAEMARDGPVILTRKGKPIISVKDVSRSDWESLSLANNQRFRALIEESRRSYHQEGGIRIEDLRQDLGLPEKPRRASRKKRAASDAKRK